MGLINMNPYEIPCIEQPEEYWLICYGFMEGNSSMETNIAINTSPVKWLLKQYKAAPEALTIIKMALPITKEEFNLI